MATSTGVAAAAAAASASAPATARRTCLLEGLDLHPSLRARINEVYPLPPSSASKTSTSSLCSTTTKTANADAAAAADAASSPATAISHRLDAVLYLPTVVLRCEHNPAFALACHVANALRVPLVVLAVVPDDAATPRHRSSVPPGVDDAACSRTIAMTSRRLAFHLEALSSSCQSWSDHGAACAVRIHGPKCRTPDHLTLARRCRFVVTDEPFVDPYLGLVQRVEKAARGSGVRCVRVDGSTTVPPCAVLRRLSRRRAAAAAAAPGRSTAGSAGTVTAAGTAGGTAGATTTIVDDDDPSAPLLWEGVPAKAWMWQKKTEGMRMGHIRAAMGEGAFDAPELVVKVDRDRFFDEVVGKAGPNDDGRKSGTCAGDDGDTTSSGSDGESASDCPSTDPAFLAALPPTWRNSSAPAPGTRPWSTSDLASVPDLKEFASRWPGADPAVPPCPQTVGTHRAGMARWNGWVRDRSGLQQYGRRRNDMRQPHAPSRMSCYLNLGVVSVFRLVHEVKAAQARGVGGADKYEEEIVKWREMAYAFCFSRTDYCGVGAVPNWAARSLDQQMRSGGGGGGGLTVTSPFEWNSLALGQTGHDRWDAMQRYLVATGELHNNVRMTWGKTVVGWASRVPKGEGTSVAASVLRALCYLNDRYALDGLSPPSYAGLLWCMGWCDKPGKGGGISPKPASNYRYSPEDFRLAESALLAGPNGCKSISTGDSGGSASGMKHSASQSSILDMMKKQQPKAKKQRTGDEGRSKEGKDASSVVKEIDSTPKPSPGINGAVKKKGSIASFFSPKSTGK